MASNPQEAIKLYGERWQEIRLILLDYLLPEMSGDLVFETLKQLNPAARVVLLTGCEKSVAAKMFKNGLWDYLQKPFDLSDLDQKVRDAIDAPELAQSPA